MNKPKDQIDPRLESLLDEIRDVPARDPGNAELGRAHFLSQAVVIREEAVSRSPRLRLKEWLDKFKKPKEFKMTTLVSILTILGLLMGSGAGTVYAAQDSNPNEALYGLKIASENLRLKLTGDAEKQLNLLLEFANRRGDEIKTLVVEGESPPETTLAMLNTQLQQARQLAGELDGEAKLKVENVIRNQMQLMLKLQENASEEGARLMEQARIAMENQLRAQQDGAGEQQGQSQNKNQGDSQSQGQNQDQGQDQDQWQQQGQDQDQGLGQDQEQGSSENMGQSEVSPGSDNGQGQSNNNQGEDPCAAYYASLTQGQGQNQGGKGKRQSQGQDESQEPVVYGLNGEICKPPSASP